MDIFKLILGVAVLGGIVYLEYKTKFWWKFIGWWKWREVQPEVQNIKNIYKDAIKKNNIGTLREITTNADGNRDIKNKVKKMVDKASWEFDKNISKKSNRDFDKSRRAYDKYITFCKDKKIGLPNNHAEIEELIDSTEDALLTPEELLDKKLKRATEQYDEVYSFVDEAGQSLYEKRRRAVSVIEKAEELVNSLARSPKAFETDIEQIDVQKKRFKTTIEFGIEQTKVLETSSISAGAGVAAGAAVASLAPTAAMWVATTFGTASTGTAIATLSGAAAESAALAWLGGGALAVGGGGMAAGHALLALAGPIGWGIAGTSLLMSLLLGWKKRRKIQESKKEETVRLNNCTEALKEIKGRIDAISIKTDALLGGLCDSLSSHYNLKGQDYTLLSDEQKGELGNIVNNTKMLSALLNETITE